MIFSGCEACQIEEHRAQQLKSIKAFFPFLLSKTWEREVQSIFLFFLLVQTAAGCDYHRSTGSYVQSQTITLLSVLFFRPISSYLTDGFPRQQSIILLFAALLELVGLISLLVLVAVATPGELNPWIILVISTVKQILEVQLLNSSYKIFKMRLQLVCGLESCDDQCHIISAVGIFSELAELLCNLTCCITAYILMTSGFSFEVIKYVYFGTTLVASLSCVVLSYNINRQAVSYYAGSEESAGRVESADRVGRVGSAGRRGMGSTESKTIAGSTTLQDNAVLTTTTLQVPLLQDTVGNTLTLEEIPITTCHSRIQGICGVPVALGSILLIALLYGAQELLYNVESLAIPGRHLQNETATVSNFCAGYLTETIFQDVWENFFYLLGTFFFLAVLKRMKPLIFFRWLVPLLMLILIILAAVVVSVPNVDQLVLALALQCTVALEYFLLLYVKYLSIAAVASKYYGVLSFVIGSLQSIVDIIIYGCMAMNVSMEVLHFCMYVFMVGCVVFSFVFSVSCRKVLIHVK